jgi:hypothetical protein
VKIESVRALKAEILERIVQPFVHEAREQHRFGLRTGSVRRVTGIERGIALGIAGGTGKQDYRLAVRIQRRALEEPALRTQIEAAARQEADIRYVGRITKGTPKGTPAPPWHRSEVLPLPAESR